MTSYEFFATWLRAHRRDDDRGASLVEYALLIALVAVVCVVAIRYLGNETDKSFSSTGSGLALN